MRSHSFFNCKCRNWCKVQKVKRSFNMKRPLANFLGNGLDLHSPLTSVLVSCFSFPTLPMLTGLEFNFHSPNSHLDLPSTAPLGIPSTLENNDYYCLTTKHSGPKKKKKKDIFIRSSFQESSINLKNSFYLISAKS